MIFERRWKRNNVPPRGDEMTSIFDREDDAIELYESMIEREEDSEVTHGLFDDFVWNYVRQIAETINHPDELVPIAKQLVKIMDDDRFDWWYA
jgi:hypothetical protein